MASIGRWVPLLAAAWLLPNLGGPGLWEPWEVRVLDGGTPLTAIGMRIFGEGAGGARAAAALAGVATLVAIAWAGTGLFGKRVGLLATAMMASMPLFVLQARQVTSDMPLVLALALALGGLGRFLWHAGGQEASRNGWPDLLVGLVGLGLGVISGGVLLGVFLPLLSVVATLLVTRDQAARVRAALGLAAAALLIALVVPAYAAGAYSTRLGGVPRGGAATTTFEYFVRQAGFGLFPWSALAVVAVGRPLAAPERQAPARLFLLFFAAFGVALATLRTLVIGEARFAVLAPIALAIGVFLDDRLERADGEPVTGFLVLVGTMLVARDLSLSPADLVSVHTLAQVTWPPAFSIRPAVLLTGALFGGAVLASSGTAGHRRIASVAVAVATALVFSLYLMHAIVPSLSRHFSSKTVLDRYAMLARENEPLARYRVEVTGPGSIHAPSLPTAETLVAYLAEPRRAFALVATGELAPLDTALKLASVPYAIADASSSRFLLLTNHLGPGVEDANPLLPWVSLAASPPWAPPRRPIRAIFGDAIELVGADFPAAVRRPGDLTLTLQLVVRRRPPPGYGIFVHLQLPGEPLVNGDHAPVGGIFPTAHWLPGEHIRDRHAIELPLVTVPAGAYALFVGFWLGGERARLPITGGASDGMNRCPLGTVEIR